MIIKYPFATLLYSNQCIRETKTSEKLKSYKSNTFRSEWKKRLNKI